MYSGVENIDILGPQVRYEHTRKGEYFPGRPEVDVLMFFMTLMEAFQRRARSSRACVGYCSCVRGCELALGVQMYAVFRKNITFLEQNGVVVDRSWQEGKGAPATASLSPIPSALTHRWRLE